MRATAPTVMISIVLDERMAGNFMSIDLIGMMGCLNDEIQFMMSFCIKSIEAYPAIISAAVTHSTAPIGEG
jgi:hypothetical protein